MNYRIIAFIIMLSGCSAAGPEGGGSNGSGSSQGPLTLKLKVKLEGYREFLDRSTLSPESPGFDPANAGFPLNQPFSGGPFFYSGEEVLDPSQLDRVYSGEILDWVLIRVRPPEDPNQVVGSVAGILLKSGSVVQGDGMSPIQFTGVPGGRYLVSVQHRSHLSGLSSKSFVFAAGGAGVSADLTVPANLEGAPGLNFKVNAGVAYLAAGDLDQDGRISAQDEAFIQGDSYLFGYLASDLNGDGSSDISDLALQSQNIGSVSALKTTGLSLKVFLEGPYSGRMAHPTDPFGPASFDFSSFTPDPNASIACVPFSMQQPFSSFASFEGIELLGESVFTEFATGEILDWVLIELRSSTDASRVISARAGLLKRTGEVLDLGGSGPLLFHDVPSGSYRVSVRHRNHVGILSKGALQLAPGATASLDLTQVDQVHGSAGTEFRVDPDTGAVLMAGGDLNQDGKIDGSDGAIFDGDSAGFACGYHASDVDMNGQTDNSDAVSMSNNSAIHRPF